MPLKNYTMSPSICYLHPSWRNKSEGFGKNCVRGKTTATIVLMLIFRLHYYRVVVVPTDVEITDDWYIKRTGKCVPTDQYCARVFKQKDVL